MKYAALFTHREAVAVLEALNSDMDTRLRWLNQVTQGEIKASAKAIASARNKLNQLRNAHTALLAAFAR